MADPKNLKEAIDTISDLQTQNEALKSESESKDEVINELRSELTAAKKEVVSQKTIVSFKSADEATKDKSGDYEVAINKFTFDGHTYETEDLVKNQELIDKLVIAEAAVLVKIEK